MALWNDEGDQPLLAGLLGSVPYLAANLSVDTVEGLLDTLKVGQPVMNALTGILCNVRVWDYPAGTPRDLAGTFAALHGDGVRLEIDDPFLLVDDRSRRALVTLLTTLQTHGASFDYVALTWREKRPGDAGDIPEVEQSEMERLLVGGGFDPGIFNMRCRPYRERRTFHDRVMRARVGPLNASSRPLQWDLSSGVGNLMDPSCEAKVYTLRHSVITDLVRGGLPVLTVAQLSGTSVAMIERHYGHLVRDDAEKALAGLML